MIMNKLPSFLSLLTILLASLACGSPGVPTEAPTKPEPTAALSVPSRTPKPPSTATGTSTKVPTAATRPSPAPTETEGIADIGNDRFRLTDPPMQDERIGEMKFRLMDLGYLFGPPPCSITSSFYTYATDAAVLLFQETNGLEVDGIVGPITWGTLFSAEAIPAPVLDSPPVEAEPRQLVMPGKAFVITGEQTWIMENTGMLTAFTMDGEFDGFYMVEPLPGEEMYEPFALWFDGAYLWIAQQGPGEALVQAYDPNKASPVEGLLKPVFNRSTHFSANQTFTAAASDGKTLWLVIEDQLEGNILLQPIDLPSRSAGTPFRIGGSSGYPFGYSLAYDPNSGHLWMTYGDELFGEGAVLEIDPASQEILGTLPVCGQQVAYDGNVIWVARESQMLALDPASGTLKAQASIGSWVNALYVFGDEIWVMTYEGTLFVVARE